MYADGWYCIDVLDQLSAVSAAIDAVAVLVLEDHVNACVRVAIDAGDTDEKVTELISPYAATCAAGDRGVRHARHHGPRQVVRRSRRVGGSDRTGSLGLAESAAPGRQRRV